MREAIVPNTNGRYIACEDGSIYSLYHRWGKRRQPLRLAPQHRSDGYLIVCLTLPNGTRKSVAVHRIIAATFLPYREGALEVNHKDGDIKNNRLSNLEYVSRSENMLHSYRTLGHKHKTRLPQPVICVELNELYLSQTDAAEAVDGAVGNISKAVLRGCRCRGYHWVRAQVV